VDRLAAQLAALQEKSDERHEENLGRFGALETKLAVLGVRLNIWGAIAAGVPALIVIGFELWRASLR
jgi:hypothetical protein